MFANNDTSTKEVFGNVKIFISDDRLIYKIYPYKFENQEYKKFPRIKRGNESSDEKKMINAYSKQMSVLGYALCNEWQYFFTGTIDPKVYDSSSFKSSAKLISNVFRSIRSKYGNKVKYMFILEQHKNGNYHAHGLCCLPDEVVNPFPCYIDSKGKKIYPSKSKFIQYGIDQNYYNLGLNTISPVIDKGSVADYCIKYMTKAMSSGSKFSNSVFHSLKLNKFKIEYGYFIGDSFKSILGITSSDDNKYGIDNIYDYKVKSYGNLLIKEFTIKLK